MTKQIIVLLASLTLMVTAAIDSIAQDSKRQRRIAAPLRGQLINAVEELKSKMEADTLLRNSDLMLGTFKSSNLRDSNFDLEFERQVQELLSEKIVKKSDFTLIGEYNAIDGNEPENQDLPIAQIVLKIVNKNFNVLQTAIREVNDTADLGVLFGVTAGLPDSKDAKVRLVELKKARENPQFALRDNLVTALGQPEFAVGILRHPNGSSSSESVVPTDENGMAFVALQVDDRFSIALNNFDSDTRAVAKITIDGLEVVNEFRDDGGQSGGYVIEPGSEHIVPGWLRSLKDKQNNVFKFVVNAMGQGAATERKARGPRGVITVQFFEASETADQLPARAFGEIGRGELMDVDYQTKKLFLRETPISTVSIRYSR
jgi:hypothetical protein